MAMEWRKSAYASCLGAVYSLSVFAGHLPLWELRLGMAGSEVPHYRGSPHTESYLIPIPYFIYRGDDFRISDEGAQQILIDQQGLRLDISVAAGLPTPAGANPEREGMPRLETTIEAGPQLELNLWRSQDERDTVWLHLPVRATFSIDDWTPRYEGINVPPYLQFRVRRGSFEHELSAGPIFADRHYHEYFYEVPSEYATASRPEYHPGSGYSGVRLTVSLRHRLDRQWIGCFARYDWLDDTAFRDSPLVISNHYVIFGCGATWRVLQSKEPAKHESWTGH